MGLLDDAIREHLELKRRRGADPAEVARQEDEALGPPRRGEFADAEGATATPAPVVEPDPEPDVVEDLPEAVPAPEALADPIPEPLDPPEPEPEPEPWLEPEPITDQPTQAFTPPDVEPDEPAARADEAQGATRDELEETPDFLEETPEHDRLWFEQKPPRGFDFDG
jgi:hypothetical protein